MMKRICALLALLLAICALPAMAAEGDAMLGRTDDGTTYFSYCFTDGDTLYMTSWDSVLYSYRVGDADLTLHGYVLDIEEDSDVAVLPFCDGEKLYALTLTTVYREDVTDFQGAVLGELVPQGDDFRFEPICDVDWSDLVEYYDDNAYPTRPEAVVGMGGKALLRYYDASGSNVLSALDLQTGTMSAVDAVTDVSAMTPYRDGTLLVESYNYNAPDSAALLAYDPASDSAQLLGEVAVENYSPLQGLAYDAATDTVYCVKSGEVRPVDLAAGEVGEGVTDMPVESYGSATAACVLNGGYYAFCYEGAVIRNLDPAQKAATKLKINDYSWNESVSNAYYRFANTHGDVSVVLSRDYAESEHLIENMMNRDDSIDIYVLNTTTATYDALYNRGYLMELDGGEKVKAFADAMYPSLREALSTNGHLVALPVWVYGSTMGIGDEAMKAMGLTIDDIPDNWSDFLDFLKGLEGQWDAQSNYSVFYSGYSVDSMRYTLFMALFEDYQRYASANQAMGFDTPLLRGLVEKLEQLDLEALGCLSEEEAEDDANYSGYLEDNRPVLIQPDCGSVIGNYYGDATPVLLGVDPAEPARLMLETMVVVVNPFTKNLDNALAFVDEVADNLTDAARYNFDPSLNEPVRGKWNEQSIAETREVLDMLRDDLEQAEPADRQLLEDNIRDVEKNLEDLEANAWDISEKEIAWYRAHDDALALAPYNWLYDSSDEESGGGEAWTLISQYLDKQIGAQELLSGIDRKVQMMLQEGR